MVDIETLVKLQRARTVVFGRFAMMRDSKMETGFLIREDKRQIEAIPSLPKIYFKAVMFEDHGIMPVAVLIKIEGIGNPYDTWWNFQIKEVCEYFDDMILQDHLLVHLYSDQKREKSIKVRNSLNEPFERFRERIIQGDTWTTDQFISAHRKICRKYQTVQEMWDFLGRQNPVQRFSNN